MMKRHALPLALTVSLALLLSGCKPPAAEKPDAAPSPGASDASATAVRVAVARSEQVEKLLPITGSIAATQSVDLAPKLSARLTFVAGREGESVRAGQIALRQDTADLDTQVASASAAIRQSEAQVRSAEANLQSALAKLASARTQTRLQGSTSDAGVKDAEQQVKSARASLELARTPQRTQEVRVAENAVAQAQANFDKAASDRKRYEELLNEGAIAQITFDGYATQEKVAKAQLDSSKQQFAVARDGGRDAAVRQSQAALARAEFALRLAKANTKQIDVRRDDVKAAEAAVAQTRAAVSQAQAAVSQSRASLASARQQVANATVSIPFSGVISKRAGEPGQLSGPTASVLTVVALGSVFFEAQVPETDIGQLSLGQNVEVSADAYKGKKLSGRIAKIYPSGSTSSRAFVVRIAVPNDDARLRPGMFARGNVVQERRTGTVVPKDALVRTDSGPVVFVAVSGKAVKRTVETGLSSKTDIEIVKGVAVGESVIVTGQNGLRDGASIRIPAEKPAQAAKG